MSGLRDEPGPPSSHRFQSQQGTRSPDDALVLRGFFLCGTAPKVPGSCGMVGDPKECREHAKECLEQARSAPTLLVTTKFESLAHLWLRLAHELESLDAVLRRLEKPEPKAS
jgi:hypothetical protein